MSLSQKISNRSLYIKILMVVGITLTGACYGCEGDKHDSMLRDFMAMPGLMEYVISIVEEGPSDHPMLVVFYSNICDACPSYNNFFFLLDKIPNRCRPTVVLGPANKQHDIFNLDTSIKSKCNVLIASSIEQGWNSFSARYGYSAANGICLVTTSNSASIFKFNISSILQCNMLIAVLHQLDSSLSIRKGD
jgi:hypothetical protein